MKYFRSLPSIYQPDNNNNYVAVTNILTRAYLLPSLQNNINLYYDYIIKDFDKPESIAYKYYNDQYRYWMILYANNIFDPLSEWPLTYENLMLQLVDKYKVEANGMSVIAYTQSIIHHYEKIITTYNDVDNQKTSITIEIDSDTYTNLLPSIQTKTLPDGSKVTQEIQKTYVTLYDYEISQNENKRKIKLIKDQYATDMESKLTSLMS